MSEGWDDSGTDESGRRLRLIGERVEFYAPRDAHAMVLEIRSTAPLPQTMTVTVFVNGNVVGRIHLDDHAWRSVEYAIPVSPGSRLARIDLLVDPAARLRPAAERERGVVARDVQWRR
jgi:hypothetical protein